MLFFGLLSLPLATSRNTIEGYIVNDSRSLAILACATLFSATAMAGNSIDDTHTFRLGVYSQSADITAISSVDPFPIVEVDLVDDIDGEYLYTDLGTEYRITDRFAIGASYQVATIDVISDEDDDFIELEIDFSGPSIYFSYGF